MQLDVVYVSCARAREGEDLSDVDEELAERAKARIGRTVCGKYRIERVLGVGGMHDGPEDAADLVVTELFVEGQWVEELWMTKAAAR